MGHEDEYNSAYKSIPFNKGEKNCIQMFMKKGLHRELHKGTEVYYGTLTREWS